MLVYDDAQFAGGGGATELPILRPADYLSELLGLIRQKAAFEGSVPAVSELEK